MTRIASHRGGTLEFGDSTPTGFRNTASLPLEEVEFDLHPTMDGAIMVHHDPTLDGTTDKVGEICRLTEADMRTARINYTAGEHPLSLEELCAIYADSAVNFRCEFKPDRYGAPYPDFVPKAVDVLRQHNMLERTGFSSFLIDTLDELARCTSRPCLWLVGPALQKQLGIATVIEVAQAHAIPEIGLNIDHAEPWIMRQVQQAGIDFGCWAAHDAAQITKALQMKVKVFTTDRPTLAIAVRDSFAQVAAQ